MDEAKAAAKEVKRLNPKMTATYAMKFLRIQNPVRNAWYKALLLRAGLPE